MRTTIIGLPASGKTTLARRISEKLSIPHIQIDRFWFEAGGLRVEQGLATPEERDQTRAYLREKVLEAIGADSWVSDGFYSRVQSDISARADVIIYLNISLAQRLLAHAKRIFKPGRHNELTIWNELKFFADIIHRTFRRGPKMKRFIDERRDNDVELRSWKEIDDYLSKITE